ncbi:MAG: Peptidase S8 and S53, subtilisin, kexin, sedolisin [uncultured Lysobacter sp.]|uniref:Peptidase S8 and S53, subtilisin, kexin, sedolisin n=1 Tax=uncultured Lysobacter sp. TaxID=271060 RepID=A0A6J4LDC9_9GAMM|nr:MAG: Peptidase S8 and S53, subtilisin, kexin, sedolisin [uncultured Lysobacter sp.]
MKLPFRTGALAGAVIAMLGLCSTASAAGRPDLVLAGLKAGRPHQVDQLIVKYRDGASAADQSAVRQGLGAAKVDTIRAGNSKRGETALLRLPPGLSVAAAVKALSSDPSIEYVEPNWIYTHAATSNDTYVTNGSLWGMYGDASSPANQYGSQAAEAWTRGHTDCSGVLVGVIDEGIYFNHEDLAPNIWTNPYDPVDGRDNDGNGYVDDVRGWDFDGNSNNINSGGANDDHGTHVSGTIAGVGGNGKGVAGSCWSGVKLISARFLGRNGGTTANAVKSVDYFNDLKTRHGLNIVATNNSWGGGGFSQALSDAITRANNAGILFIAAAGNSAVDNDTTASYPSNYPQANIIAVASITNTGALSSFSQWGKTTVDIGAPGSGIFSTVPKSAKGQLVSGYASYNGTSMATPHVTGAAALYKSSHAAATAADVKAAILGAAIPTPSLQGKVVTDGRLDASGF